jgi:hypothetical protein
MIDKILTNSKNSEVYSSLSLILDVLGEKDWTANTFLHKLIEELKHENTMLSTAILRIKVESEIKNKNAYRNQKLRALHHLIYGYCSHPDADIREAAEQAMAVFNKYGLKIIDESYPDESSKIVSMLRDYTTDKMQDSTSYLHGVNRLIGELQSAQDDFHSYFISYEKQKTEEDQLESAYNIRTRLLKRINDELITLLRAIHISQKAEYGEVCDTVATIVVDNNYKVRRRSKAIKK